MKLSAVIGNDCSECDLSDNGCCLSLPAVPYKEILDLCSGLRKLIGFESYLYISNFELQAVNDFEREQINQVPDSTVIDRNFRLLHHPILEGNHIIILIIELIVIDMDKVP